MNLKKSDELLLLIENNPNTIISQTKSRTTNTLFLILIKSIDTFHSNPKLLLQEEIYLIDKTKSEVNISFFIKTDQNNSFAIYRPGYWQVPNTKKTKRVRGKNKFKSKLVTRRRNQQQRLGKKRSKTYRLSDLEDYSKLIVFCSKFKKYEKQSS